MNVKPTRYDRLLAALLRVVVTGLIALIAAVAVMAAYSGFMHLVRVHFRQAGWMLGVAALCAGVAWALGTRRGDLADC